MAEPKKRGGQRKSEEEKSKNVQFSIRIPTEMKARLQASAQEHNKKLNGEIHSRLETSLSRISTNVMQDAFGGDRTFFFMMLLAQVVTSVEATTQSNILTERDKGKWLDDPFVFAKVCEGFIEVLDQLRPEGEPEADEGMLMPPEFVGAANALGVLDGIRQAPKTPPKPRLDDDGVSHQFSDQKMRFPLIKAALGKDVVSRIGKKK
jgi:hypothetical protein